LQYIVKRPFVVYLSTMSGREYSHLARLVEPSDPARDHLISSPRLTCFSQSQPGSSCTISCCIIYIFLFYLPHRIAPGFTQLQPWRH